MTPDDVTNELSLGCPITYHLSSATKRKVKKFWGNTLKIVNRNAISTLKAQFTIRNQPSNRNVTCRLRSATDNNCFGMNPLNVNTSADALDRFPFQMSRWI